MAFHHLALYKLMPLVQILLTLFSFYYFFRALTSRALSRLDSLNCCLFLLLIYLFQMPRLSEGIYNYTSAVDYHSGIIITVLYLGLMTDYFMKHYFLHRAFHFFLGTIFLIVAIGFNEIITLILISFHLLALFSFFIHRKTISSEWWILLAVCLLFSAIMLLAPGNSVRSLSYPDNHDFFRSLAFSLMQVCRFGFEWISGLPLVLLSFLFISLISEHQNKIPFFTHAYFFKPWVSILLLAWILFASAFPPYWGTNILGQHRTVNIACFFFLLYWFICTGLYANKYLKKTDITFLFNKNLKMVAACITICILFTTKNGYDVFTDIFYGRAEIFDVQMQKRFDVLGDSANKNKTVVLEPLAEKPGSIFVLDLSEDPANWINSCQAKYFGVKEIVYKDK